jgi:hypothetical protein
MSFVQRELTQISRALMESSESPHYAELYAAQQALAWVLEPNGFASPMKMITGTPVGSEDYLSSSNPAQS